MCLIIQSKDIAVPKTGWKVFLNRHGELVSPVYSAEKGYEKGKWYEADSVIIADGVEHFYHSGFHIFTDKKSAEAYAEGLTYYEILEVEFDDILAKGIQFEGPCIVARRMKICV